MIALHIIEYIDIKYTTWLLVYINVYMKSESERLSVVSDSVIPWTISSMEFPRLEYWSGSLSLL